MPTPRGAFHVRSLPVPALRWTAAAAAVILALVAPRPAEAQRIIKTSEQVLTVSKGTSVLVVNAVAVQRFSLGDPDIAEVVAVSPTELVVNARALGTTSLFLWDNTGDVRLYTVEVTADATGLQRYLQAVLPGESIDVTASGNTVTLSGAVRDASVASRAVEIAKSSGATIVDNLTTPDAVQILLQVRFAEVNRTAVEAFRAQFTTVNPQDLSGSRDVRGSTNATPPPNTSVLGAPSGATDGLLNFGLFTPAGGSIEALIRALSTRGDFKSLAEPNLVTLPGKEASFLAGGEFPYPSIQGGGGTGAVAIQFREFGIKLKFTPVITRNGSIRLKVAPEVSSLDFGNALVFGGFTVPSLLTRRAETEVEMRDGQYLAIAGLLDNSLINNVSKIPILGDLPILGQFFRSKDARQQRTELLVLVTPKLIVPSANAAPLPTGEPGDWKWNHWMRPSTGADSTSGSGNR